MADEFFGPRCPRPSLLPIVCHQDPESLRPYLETVQQAMAEIDDEALRERVHSAWALLTIAVAAKATQIGPDRMLHVFDRAGLLQ